ncbi:uncharacterized protein METZ01_LOCUS80119, partial [marine metagenome]
YLRRSGRDCGLGWGSQLQPAQSCEQRALDPRIRRRV